MARSRAAWRYDLRVIALSAAYGGLLIAAVWLFKHHAISGPAAWIVAILPAVPICGMFAAIGLYLVDETDEYLRLMMVRQTLWASGFAFCIATVWGFLESFGLVGHVESYCVAILWYAGLGLGGLANGLTTLRQRRAG